MGKKMNDQGSNELSALLKGAWKVYARGDFSVVWGMFQRILKIDFNQPRAWYGIGRIWYERGCYRHAKTCFKRAWLLDKQWYYLEAYGIACIQLKWYSEALKVAKMLVSEYGRSRLLFKPQHLKKTKFYSFFYSMRPMIPKSSV